MLSPPRRRWPALPLAGPLLVLLAFSTFTIAEDWTDLQGTRTIQADFVTLWDGKVVLEREGRRITIPLESLNADSRLQAQRLADAQQRERAERLEAVRQAAEEAEAEAAASAPVEIGPYVPWPEDAGPAETVQHFNEQLTAGHPRVFWDSLPPTHRRELSDLGRQFARAMDPGLYEQYRQLIHRAAQAALEKKTFVFNHPQLAALPEELTENLPHYYHLLFETLEGLTGEQGVTLEALGSGDLEPLVIRLDEILGPAVATLAAAVGADEMPEPQVEMLDENRAQVTLEHQGQSVVRTLVREQGRWIDVEIRDQWKETMESARQGIAQLPEILPAIKQQGSMPLMAAGGFIAQLENVQTQEQFNELVDPMIETLMGLIPSPEMFQPFQLEGFPGAEGLEGFGAGLPLDAEG